MTIKNGLKVCKGFVKVNPKFWVSFSRQRKLIRIKNCLTKFLHNGAAVLPFENVNKHVNKAFRGFEPEPKGSKTCFDRLNFLTPITPISPFSSLSSLSTLSSISVPLHSISLYHFHFNFNVGLLKTKTSKGDPSWDQSLARPPNLTNPSLQQNESLPPGVRSLKPPGQDVKTIVRSPLTNII